MRTLLTLMLAGCTVDAPSKEQLGKQLFIDRTLSTPAGQSCADCHAPAQAFRDPESDRTTSMGAVDGRFGSRNAPTAMYAATIPPLHYDGRWVGGLFWDGRASSLEEQAAGPLLNPLEMNNADHASVVAKVRRAPYASAFRDVYGGRALDDTEIAFGHITDAIAAYERSPELSPYSSRYDRFAAGTGTLTPQELRGYRVFDANCTSCHPPPAFTTFEYVNLGLPRYENNMYLRQDPTFVDHGLATTVNQPTEDGKFRVPTLRNIARTAPYGHNGYFENLPFMLEFLNTRDVGSTQVASCSRVPASQTRCQWPAPEVPATVDHRVGNLGLSPGDLEDLAAFLETLDDN
jgi:cytochrome c peroxidase